MIYPIVLERIILPEFPAGHYHAHIPALGLTTHGLGVEGARAAALDLARQWIAEKRANGESVAEPADCFLATLEIPDDALQSA